MQLLCASLSFLFISVFKFVQEICFNEDEIHNFNKVLSRHSEIAGPGLWNLDSEISIKGKN